MRVFIMRHAIATPPGMLGFAHDAQRPLTQEGRIQAREVARGLKRLDAVPEAIMASPYVRAMQTAEEVARVFGQRVPVKTLIELQAETEPAQTSKALAGLSSHATVLCVGHEPHLSAWIAHLVAGRDGMSCEMKKGGVACVELERVPPAAGSGTLRWLMSPKQLTLIGKA